MSGFRRHRSVVITSHDGKTVLVKGIETANPLIIELCEKPRVGPYRIGDRVNTIKQYPENGAPGAFTLLVTGIHSYLKHRIDCTGCGITTIYVRENKVCPVCGADDKVSVEELPYIVEKAPQKNI